MSLFFCRTGPVTAAAVRPTTAAKVLHRDICTRRTFSPSDFCISRLLFRFFRIFSYSLRRKNFPQLLSVLIYLHPLPLIVLRWFIAANYIGYICVWPPHALIYDASLNTAQHFGAHSRLHQPPPNGICRTYSSRQCRCYCSGSHGCCSSRPIIMQVGDV